jgi:hypothetical protein
MPRDETGGFADRLQALVDRYGHGSVGVFAELVGVPRRSVAKVLEGAISNPGITFARAILEALPGEDARWLLTGRSTPWPVVERALIEQRARELVSQMAGELAPRGRKRA